MFRVYILYFIYRYIKSNIDVYVVRDFISHENDFAKEIIDDIKPYIIEFIQSNTSYLLKDSNLPKLNQIAVEEILSTPNISVSSKLYLTNQVKKFCNILKQENGINKREIDIWFNKTKDLIRKLNINKDSIFIYSLYILELVINDTINIISALNSNNMNKKIRHKFIYNKIETKTIIVQLQPSSDGIINELSNNGYGNINLIINGKNLQILKELLLIQNNEYLSSLINESNNDEIKLSNEISEYEFKLMMKYYGYTKIDLNGENIIPLMKASYCLKDIIVYNDLKKYNTYLNFHII